MTRYATETQEQITIIKYCDLKKIPIYAIPNGGYRNVIEARNLKLQGVKSGVPDMCIPLARKGYHGLYIELKVGKNKTSINQQIWLNLLADNGYKAEVCYGAGQAIDLIEWYIKE